MSIYIVEYGPNITNEACNAIQNNIEPEMSNEESALYEIGMCIEILADFPKLQKDIDYLNKLADNDTHPVAYIEF